MTVNNLLATLVLAAVCSTACGSVEKTPETPIPVIPPDPCDCNNLANVCHQDDGDHPLSIPVHTESMDCSASANPDATAPLFGVQSEDPHFDAWAVHEICTTLDPSPHTDDEQAFDDIRSLFARLITRPALARVLADLPPSERLPLVDSMWLDAFEHILCGEANSDGTVGGQHLWSEFYFAEQEGAADYMCSHEGLNDPDIATVRYQWRPQPGSSELFKSVGGFHVGMSPACLLAVGVRSRRCRCPTSATPRATFRTEIHGSWVDWVMWNDSRGNLDTLFPLADDAPGRLTP